MLADTEEARRKELGERLQRARRAARPRISQAEMGRRVGVVESTIQKYESGASWDQSTVDLILRELGLPADHLEDDREQRRPVTQEEADLYWWRQLDTEVQDAMMVVSVFLSHYRGEERRREMYLLSAYTLERDKGNLHSP